MHNGGLRLQTLSNSDQTQLLPLPEKVQMRRKIVGNFHHKVYKSFLESHIHPSMFKTKITMMKLQYLPSTGPFHQLLHQCWKAEPRTPGK